MSYHKLRTQMRSNRMTSPIYQANRKIKQQPTKNNTDCGIGRIAVTNFPFALYPYLCTQIRLMQNIFKYLEPKLKFPRKIVFLSNSANTFRAVVFFSSAVIIFFSCKGTVSCWYLLLTAPIITNSS